MTDDPPQTEAPATMEPEPLPTTADSGPDASAGAEAQADTLARIEAEAAADADAATEAAIDANPSSADYSTAFSPRNVAVGLAIVAGLVAFAASRHRRGRRTGREDG